MKEILKRQMEFEHWANNELLIKLKEAHPLNERALVLFSHIMSVNQIWLNRLKAEPVSVKMFQDRTLAECEAMLYANLQAWQKFFNEINENDLRGEIKFQFPIDNTTRVNTVADSIFHITNHSSYHRGQIVSLIKGTVSSLPNLGYVFFSSRIV